MSTNSWSSAFKEIYGKTPTKSDYSLAPEHIRSDFFAACPKSPAAKKNIVKTKEIVRTGVRLKRPAADDEWSPVKRPAKRVALAASDSSKKPTVSASSTPSASILKASTNRALFEQSPQKQVSFSPKKAVRTIPSTSKSPSRRIEALRSPSRVAAIRSPSSRATSSSTKSPFRSIFDTPEKGASPMAEKDIELDLSSAPPTPKRAVATIKSPRKPVRNIGSQMKNIANLLLPTPEKKVPEEEEEELEQFPTENVPIPAKKTKKTAGGEAKAFDPKTGKVVKRAFKRPPASGGTATAPRVRTKKADENYVRINMKKKSFVRGKVSAEQKRKMRRKQNWKKRFGGAK